MMRTVISFTTLFSLSLSQTLQQWGPEFGGGNGWPLDLQMPFSFEAECYLYDYDGRTQEMTRDKDELMKVRYVDGEHNIYGIDINTRHTTYKKRVYYNEHRIVEKNNEEYATYSTYDYDVNIREYYKYLYDWNNGLLVYKGIT